MKKTNKIKILSLSILLSLSLTACGGNVPKDALQSNSTEKTLYYYVKNCEDDTKNNKALFDAKSDETGGSMKLPGFYEKVRWSSDLFSKDADIDNDNYDLAYLSGTLCAAAYGRRAEPRLDGKEESAEEIVGNDGEYILQALKDLDFKDENIFLYSYPGSAKNRTKVTREKNKETVMYADDNSLSFTIASRPMVIDNELMDLVVVVARGSMTPYEYAGDMKSEYSERENLGNCKAFDIVYEFEEDIAAGLNDYYNEHPDLKKGRTKFLITGHSLGGAAANLFGARLTEFDKKWADKKDIYVYTFGAIDSIYSDAPVTRDFENIHNIYNYYDSYGPNSPKGTLLYNPTGQKSNSTGAGKFGIMHIFSKDFHDSDVAGSPTYTASHAIAGYIYTLRNKSY